MRGARWASSGRCRAAVARSDRHPEQVVRRCTTSSGSIGLPNKFPNDLTDDTHDGGSDKKSEREQLASNSKCDIFDTRSVSFCIRFGCCCSNEQINICIISRH